MAYRAATFRNNAIYATETQVQQSVSSIIGVAPSALATLGQIASAMGDDANLAADLTNQISTFQAQAISSCVAYANSLAVNYDAAGSASNALSIAQTFASGLASQYDAAGAAAAALSNAQTYAQTYADGLAQNYDAAGSASNALSNAQTFASGLASQYDSAGAAAAAQSTLVAYMTPMNAALNVLVGPYGAIQTESSPGAGDVYVYQSTFVVADSSQAAAKSSDSGSGAPAPADASQSFTQAIVVGTNPLGASIYMVALNGSSTNGIVNSGASVAGQDIPGVGFVYTNASSNVFTLPYTDSATGSLDAAGANFGVSSWTVVSSM